MPQIVRQNNSKCLYYMYGIAWNGNGGWENPDRKFNNRKSAGGCGYTRGGIRGKNGS